MPWPAHRLGDRVDGTGFETGVEPPAGAARHRDAEAVSAAFRACAA